MSDELVLLTEAGDNAEASLLRAYLEEHRVFCHVQGEHHRGMLGAAGAFIALRLLVPASQLDVARDLLQRYHEAPEAEPGPEFRGAYRDQPSDDDEDDSPYDSDYEAELLRRVRKSRAINVLLPGLGHAAAGAYVRGFVLFAVFVAMIPVVALGNAIWIVLWPLALVMDWTGAADAARAKARRKAERDASSRD